MEALLRLGGPVLFGAAAVVFLDLRSRRLGLDPPGFAEPARRWIGLATLALSLALASFGWVSGIPAEPTAEQLARVPSWQLFSLHLILVAAVLIWYAAGFAGSGVRLRDQLGLRAPRPAAEIGIGALLGVGSWVVMIVFLLLVVGVLYAIGGEEAVPTASPTAVAWLAGQSVVIRIGLALSAGVVEEIFFRGLLQPRIGILGATVLFAMAHLSYGQPFMLVGITLLSLLWGLLVIWRQSLWAAIAAHAVFDLVQLLIVVPSALKMLGPVSGLEGT